MSFFRRLAPALCILSICACGRTNTKATENQSKCSLSVGGTCVVSILIVDLANNGIQLPIQGKAGQTPLSLAEKQPWEIWDDAILAQDLDGSGAIDNKGEIFGMSQGYEDGFEKLGDYDNNHDGVIDASDDIYRKLLLWKDRDANGLSTENEITTFTSMGLNKIELTYVEEKQRDDAGNEIRNRSHFFREGLVAKVLGSSGEIVDVMFSQSASLAER